MAIIGTSSVSTYEHFEEERNRNQNNAILNVGVGIGAIAGTNYLLRTDAGQSVAQRVFDLNTTNSYFRYNNFKYQDIKIKKTITLGDIILDTSKVLEEISPLKILRTFHVSSFISPYTIPNSNLKTVFLTNEQLLLDEDYVRKLISNVSPNTTGDIISELFENGGKVSNGQLLTLDDRLVMENVKLVNLAPSAEGTTDATHPFLNRIFEKFRNIHGAKDKNGFVRSALSEKGGIGIIAGKSEKELAINWARSYGRLAVEPGFKLFDRPLDVLAEVIDKTGLPEKYGAFEHLRDKLYLGAGAGGDYTQSVPRMFYKMGKNIASLTIAGALAYNYGDKLIREIAPEDSPFSKGIMEGLATGYVNARIGIASMWSDNFQDYKAKQEELAPDSTSLLTLAGFPLAGALLGANIGYFTRIKEAATKGIAQADLDATVERSSAVLDSLVGTASYTPKAMNRVGRFSAIGAVLATIPILPFLPGALIGESSEELRAEYSGDKDVEIRSTRFWGSGGMKWEGGKIKYFTKSWYAQLMNNAEDIGKYGDQETKDALNPVLNPFDYLRNPYRLEEMNQDESPYPVWGMEVSYGGVFGKLFQATIGAVIKPTIVNERLEEYIESGDIESSGGVELKQQIKESEQSLIDSGMMLAPEAAKLNTKTELMHTTYSALTDFAGLKGWIVSLASDELHTGMGDTGLQLSTSGAMNNSARSIIDANLGGMGPAGESLRRFIPTNAGSVLDKANPLRNQSPSWLPHDLDNFYIDFSSGDPFKKVEKGYFRLPGEGYASLNPELKDINPENYPYIQRFKILSDVAIGSDEYYQYKDIMDARYANNQLTEYEQGIYLDTIEKLNKRSVARDFYEEPIADNGMLGNSISKYWKLATSLSETPAESLTFLRPSAKFIHQRTAIEDYEKTQLYGSDSAMWTSPYSDFIKPTINKTIISKEVPEETLDRRAIDEYFDKLEYIKNRRLYKDALSSGDVELAKQYKNKYESTVIGALTTGLDENMEMTRAYISMPDNEKQYFAAFSNMKSEEDRIAVINMQTPEMAEMYSKIWRRKDAMMQNETPESQAAAIMDIVNDESSELISKNKGAYAKYIAGNNSRDSTFEEYLADKRAEEYISSTTGMPNDNFYGWDPRIEIDDIKLKTLTIGKEDVRKYGFWEGDEERLRRMIALDSETQVVNEIEEIKSGIRQEKLQSAIIKSELYHRGITVEEVRFHRSQSNNTNIMVGA